MVCAVFVAVLASASAQDVFLSPHVGGIPGPAGGFGSGLQVEDCCKHCKMENRDLDFPTASLPSFPFKVSGDIAAHLKAPTYKLTAHWAVEPHLPALPVPLNNHTGPACGKVKIGITGMAFGTMELDFTNGGKQDCLQAGSNEIAGYTWLSSNPQWGKGQFRLQLDDHHSPVMCARVTVGGDPTGPLPYRAPSPCRRPRLDGGTVDAGCAFGTVFEVAMPVENVESVLLPELQLGPTPEGYDEGTYPMSFFFNVQHNVANLPQYGPAGTYIEFLAYIPEVDFKPEFKYMEDPNDPGPFIHIFKLYLNSSVATMGGQLLDHLNKEQAHIDTDLADREFGEWTLDGHYKWQISGFEGAFPIPTHAHALQPIITAEWEPAGPVMNGTDVPNFDHVYKWNYRGNVNQFPSCVANDTSCAGYPGCPLRHDKAGTCKRGQWSIGKKPDYNNNKTRDMMDALIQPMTGNLTLDMSFMGNLPLKTFHFDKGIDRDVKGAYRIAYYFLAE